LDFCVVEKPMLSTTNARAAATITKAIITIADSIPITPRRVFLLVEIIIIHRDDNDIILKYVHYART